MRNTWGCLDANPSRTPLLLHLHLLRHLFRRAAAISTSSIAVPPLPPGGLPPSTPSPLAWLGEAMLVETTPSTPPQPSWCRDLSSHVLLACGIKERTSTSSRTTPCGTPCGIKDTAEVLPLVALHWIGSSRKYISSRLDESSCGDRQINPCIDKTL